MRKGNTKKVGLTVWRIVPVKQLFLRPVQLLSVMLFGVTLETNVQLKILFSKQCFIGRIMLLIIQHMCQLNVWDVQNRPSDFGRFLTMFRRLPNVLTIMTTLELLRSYINRGYYMAARRYEISHECWKIFHEWVPRTSEMFLQHEKKNFISPSGHVMFYLLYKHQWNTKPFHFHSFLVWKARFTM